MRLLRIWQKGFFIIFMWEIPGLSGLNAKAPLDAVSCQRACSNRYICVLNKVLQFCYIRTESSTFKRNGVNIPAQAAFVRAAGRLVGAAFKPRGIMANIVQILLAIGYFMC